jgi:hypothetical protein
MYDVLSLRRMLLPTHNSLITHNLKNKKATSCSGSGFFVKTEGSSRYNTARLNHLQTCFTWGEVVVRQKKVAFSDNINSIVQF